MKKVVVYGTHYGTSKTYATWIAESLNCDIYESKNAKKISFDDYDVVICGGGLYAGKILGSDILNKYDLSRKDKILFTVGLADTSLEDNITSIRKSVDKYVDDTSNLKVFNFRGGIDYDKLNMIHRPMMKMLKKMLEKKPESDLSAENREFLKTFNSQVNFCNKESIKPLLDYVDSL
jgi:menaquinone-dependent protoporphyrinogen IX oxidase